MFDEIANLHPNFSWNHAERAESTGIDEKVLSLFADKNVFIGICTKRERVLPADFKWTQYLWNSMTNVAPIWKTSDWIIQEIGLAMGRDCKLILLVESGVRPPGGLQGVVEYIPFERSAPEKTFPKLAQMISNIAPVNTLVVASVGAQSAYETEPEKPQSPPESDWKTPKPEWRKREYQRAFRLAIMLGDESTATTFDESYLATSDANDGTNRPEWIAFREFVRIVYGKVGTLQTIMNLATSNPRCGVIFRYLAQSYERFDRLQ